MIRIPLGPIEFKFYSGDNWSRAKLSFVTARSENGFAQRETAIETGFKSEHLIEAFGEEDPSTAYTAPDGTVYAGRFTAGIDGDKHVVTGQQVYASRQRAEFLRQTRKELSQVGSAPTGNGSKPAPVTAA